MTKRMVKDIDRVLGEMKYGGKSEVLALGIRKGFQYVVLNVRGMHPCGYVNISGYESSLRDESHAVTDFETERYGWIDCHGGVTFAHTAVWPFAGGYWVGWDYGHLGDYCHYANFGRDGGQQYGTRDVMWECKDVIDQIVDRIKEKRVKALVEQKYCDRCPARDTMETRSSVSYCCHFRSKESEVAR